MGATDDLGKNNFSGTVGTKAGMNGLREMEWKRTGASVAACLGALLKGEQRSGVKEVYLFCFMLLS